MLKFKDFLKQIYNEIIEKRDFKKGSKYRDEVLKSFTNDKKKNPEGLKKWLKVYNKYTRPLFKDLAGGTFKKTVIIPFNKSGGNSSFDHEEMKRFVKSQGYTVDNTNWAAGLVTKTKPGDTKVIQIAKSYSENIKKKYQELEDTKDKLENEIKDPKFSDQIKDSKKKKIVEIEEKQQEMKKFEDIASKYIDYASKDDNKYSMVFSLDPRAISSQSTKTAWSSCMNLDSGINKRYVGSGIVEGTFVVFLVLNEDIDKMNGPIARVLVKPFFNEDKKVFWYVDQVYPRGTNAAFRTAVAKILKKHNMKSEDGNYKLPEKVYDDGTSEIKIDDIYRYAEIGDFSDITSKPKDFIEKMFDKHAVKVLQNWPKGEDFPDITVKNLDASSADIRYFPKGITVTGNLNLSGTNIEKIFI